MFSGSELAEMSNMLEGSMTDHLVATREVVDEDAPANDFGDKPTVAETVYDGKAMIVDEEMRLAYRTEDKDYDAEGFASVPEWPAGTPLEGVTGFATFAGVRRPVSVVGIERSDTTQTVFFDFTGQGEAA